MVQSFNKRLNVTDFLTRAKYFHILSPNLNLNIWNLAKNGNNYASFKKKITKNYGNAFVERLRSKHIIE